jgi:hypothetical protein
MVSAVVAVAAIGCIGVPRHLRASAAAAAKQCLANLAQIDGAKQQWALDNHAGKNAAPTGDAIEPYLRTWMPHCPKGGTYTLGTIGVSPRCSIHGPLFEGEDPLYNLSPLVLTNDPIGGLGLLGATNVTYQIQSRTSLLTGTWLVVKTVTIASNGLNPVFPPEWSGKPTTYYKAIFLHMN